ncbi:MAG: ADP-ribosylglycohydrolase family protein, partial [Planctomycetaceae bacterium]|nr:ADP-ribosylglycohydrolase family protein [Planctomycetaceae bacterium]
MISLDQFQGCLLGTALGDALGAPFEGGILERLLWRAIGFTKTGERRWTDDTQMTVDLVESFLAQEKIDPDDLAFRFAKSYRWSRGYGPAAAKILRKIANGVDWRLANRSVYRNGSFGNGAAMRAPILGLIFENKPDLLSENTRLTAEITHAHPIGIEGATLLASVTNQAALKHNSVEILQQLLTQSPLQEFRPQLEISLEWLKNGSQVSHLDVTRQLGNGIAAHKSCVTAIYLAFRFREQPFLDMQHFTVRVGGDVDTIGAMAGAIWGAINGYSSLPDNALSKIEQREMLEKLATQLHHHVSERP